MFVSFLLSWLSFVAPLTRLKPQLPKVNLKDSHVKTDPLKLSHFSAGKSSLNSLFQPRPVILRSSRIQPIIMKGSNKHVSSNKWPIISEPKNEPRFKYLWQ